MKLRHPKPDPVPMKDYELGMLRAAEIARLIADENMRMADDTISLDPIISHQRHGPIKTKAQLRRAKQISERLTLEGSYYATRSHAASDVADMIMSEIAL